MYIVERPKAEFLSPCVFNNIVEETAIFLFPEFAPFSHRCDVSHYQPLKFLKISSHPRLSPFAPITSWKAPALFPATAKLRYLPLRCAFHSLAQFTRSRISTESRFLIDVASVRSHVRDVPKSSSCVFINIPGCTLISAGHAPESGVRILGTRSSL
jgi:hypothetical protein